MFTVNIINRFPLLCDVVTLVNQSQTPKGSHDLCMSEQPMPDLVVRSVRLLGRLSAIHKMSNSNSFQIPEDPKQLANWLKDKGQPSVIYNTVRGE